MPHPTEWAERCGQVISLRSAAAYDFLRSAADEGRACPTNLAMIAAVLRVVAGSGTPAAAVFYTRKLVDVGLIEIERGDRGARRIFINETGKYTGWSLGFGKVRAEYDDAKHDGADHDGAEHADVGARVGRGQSPRPEYVKRGGVETTKRRAEIYDIICRFAARGEPMPSNETLALMIAGQKRSADPAVYGLRAAGLIQIESFSGGLFRRVMVVASGQWTDWNRPLPQRLIDQKNGAFGSEEFAGERVDRSEPCFKCGCARGCDCRHPRLQYTAPASHIPNVFRR